MFCDKCKKNQATVHFTKIVNGKKTEQHLCHYCAGENEDTYTFGDMFKNVFNIDPLGSSDCSKANKKCGNCGLTLDELSRYGRLGCAQCCDSFKGYIEGALKNIHSITSHSGKSPGKAVKMNVTANKKDELKKKLNEAIINEEYEKAAEIRDILRNMEKEA